MTGDPAAAEPSVAIREAPPSPRRLSRKTLLGAALLIGAVIVLALVTGLSDRAPRVEGEPPASATHGPPETIRAAASRYRPDDLAGDATNAARAVDEDADALLAAPTDPAWTQSAPAPPSARAPAAAASDIEDPEAAARRAPILFAGVHGSAPSARAAMGGDPSRAESASAAQARASNDAPLAERLLPPRSRYALLAGAVIPAALLTELNSDLPGRVIAQVTAPVYDSVTGAHLLIPQGARLLGGYESAPRYGDRRLFVRWTRLVFPDGWSISLAGMEGASPSGAAGLSDHTDRHLDRLAGAVALSAVMSVVANRAEDGDGSDRLARDVGDAAAQEAARVGARLVDRELEVRPTLRVRAGAPVRVLVMQDIALRPYRGGAP